MSREGLIEAARFSWKCGMADKLSISDMLYKFVKTGEGELKKVRDGLEKLFSYVFYVLIAQQNSIEDFFDVRVVQAHWIGNDLLKSVTREDIRNLLLVLRDSEWDREILAWYLVDLLRQKGLPHHSFYAALNESRLPNCVGRSDNRRCSVDLGKAYELRSDLLVHTEHGLLECGFGFLERGQIEKGDNVFVHLGEARRLANDDEVDRYRIWTDRTLRRFREG